MCECVSKCVCKWITNKISCLEGDLTTNKTVFYPDLDNMLSYDDHDQREAMFNLSERGCTQ